MAIINTKYSIGDSVFHAGTTTERKRHPCPDCKDARKWSAKSPAGNEYEFDCPRCSSGYMSNRDLSLDYAAFCPCVRQLTVGSIQYNTAPGSYDHGARYMCRETGVGSGSVYNEDDLFHTEEEALKASQALSDMQNKTTEWVVKQYDKTLKVSDYQIENAALKLAKEQESRARSLLWNLDSLFETIGEAADKDAILEAVEDYKKYEWEGDKAKLTPARDDSHV